jgi:Microcystin-dependent protein
MHQLTVAEMPSHNHSYSTPAGATLTQGGTLWYPNDSAVWPPTGNTGNTGGDQAHNNMPPYYALCYIMKL